MYDGGEQVPPAEAEAHAQDAEQVSAAVEQEAGVEALPEEVLEKILVAMLDVPIRNKPDGRHELDCSQLLKSDAIQVSEVLRKFKLVCKAWHKVGGKLKVVGPQRPAAKAAKKYAATNLQLEHRGIHQDERDAEGSTARSQPVHSAPVDVGTSATPAPAPTGGAIRAANQEASATQSAGGESSGTGLVPDIRSAPPPDPYTHKIRIPIRSTSPSDPHPHQIHIPIRSRHGMGR